MRESKNPRPPKFSEGDEMSITDDNNIRHSGEVKDIYKSESTNSIAYEIDLYSSDADVLVKQMKIDSNICPSCDSFAPEIKPQYYRCNFDDCKIERFSIDDDDV